MRAAQALTDTVAGNEVVLWGHSQGGQAALFASKLAQDYAPELRLQGVAVAAPATDLAKLFRDDLGSAGGNNLSALALWAWARVQGASHTGIVHPQALPAIDTVEPWRSLIRDNSAGVLPPQRPVFITQGEADVIVQPTITREYAAKLCSAGSPLTFDSMPSVGHAEIGMKSAPTAVAWMADRFAGNPAPDQCANLLQEVVR